MTSPANTSVARMLLRWLGLLFAGAIGGAAAWAGQGHSLYIVPASISYSDLVVVILTATTAIVAVFGVLMGVLAIFGYQHFKGVAEKSAKTSAEEVISKTAKSIVIEKVNGDEVRQLILLEVAKIIEAERASGTVSPWLKEREKQEAMLDEVDKDEGGSDGR